MLSLGALVALVLTQMSPQLWWVDGATAIALAAYIFVRWVEAGRAQVEMIIGRAADPGFLSMVSEIAETHDPMLSLDVVRTILADVLSRFPCSHGPLYRPSCPL